MQAKHCSLRIRSVRHDLVLLPTQELHEEGASLGVVMGLIWRVPLLWLATIIIRAVCILLLNPLFRLAGNCAPPVWAFATPGWSQAHASSTVDAAARARAVLHA